MRNVLGPVANIVIVFAKENLLPVIMQRRASQRLPIPQASRVRRTLLMFLAFDLFVGLAHTISCTDEAFAATISSNIANIPDDGPDGDGSS